MIFLNSWYWGRYFGVEREWCTISASNLHHQGVEPLEGHEVKVGIVHQRREDTGHFGPMFWIMCGT